MFGFTLPAHFTMVSIFYKGSVLFQSTLTVFVYFRMVVYIR